MADASSPAAPTGTIGDGAPQVQWIPLAQIHIPNPRDRNERKHQLITESIEHVGLKRPITVRPRGDGSYDLVCGQGRLESFRKLGQSMVPALVREVSEEDMLLMGLIENVARRNPGSMELVRQLAVLRERGYSHRQIGEKVGMAPNHVAEHLYLYDHGEEHLLAAVETGRVSLAAAVIIARTDDAEVQAALAEAVAQKLLSAPELHRARKLAVLRRSLGKKLGRAPVRKPRPGLTGAGIVRAFRKEQARQQQALKKAELCARQLAFVAQAFRVLLHDEDFVTLLRAGGLDSLPQQLAALVQEGEDHA